MSPLPTVTTRSGVEARRIRWIATLVIFALCAAGVVSAAAFGAAYARIDCDTCHAMSPYASAHAAGAHAGARCISCHAVPGLAGTFANGVALQRMAVGALTGARPTFAATGDAPCLTCHDDVATRVVVGDSVRVRHADFLEVPCVRCHGGTGHTMEGALYAAPEMESCVGCHQVAGAQLDACATCHVEDTGDPTVRQRTSWRATHGPSWERTHGAGDLDTCTSCHAPTFCVKCHETPIPHDQAWPVTHGAPVVEAGREACLTCHESSWCDQCHGIEMPHPSDFLPQHAEQVDRSGEAGCLTCHPQESCDRCHTAHTHPDVPGVTTPKEGW